MAFTCRQCHTRPMASYCATMFEVGQADSYGPCENCRTPAACMDCSCPVMREDMPDPITRGEEFDTWLPVKRNIHMVTGPTRIDRAILRGEEATGRTSIVTQPNWQRCNDCGKTGSHEHHRGPSHSLDALLDDVLATRREALQAHERRRRAGVLSQQGRVRRPARQ